MGRNAQGRLEMKDVVCFSSRQLLNDAQEAKERLEAGELIHSLPADISFCTLRSTWSHLHTCSCQTDCPCYPDHPLFNGIYHIYSRFIFPTTLNLIALQHGEWEASSTDAAGEHPTKSCQ